jgi:hypothetical protein
MKAIGETSQWKKVQPPRLDFAAKVTPEAITAEYLQIYSVGNSKATRSNEKNFNNPL